MMTLVLKKQMKSLTGTKQKNTKPKVTLPLLILKEEL